MSLDIDFHEELVERAVLGELRMRQLDCERSCVVICDTTCCAFAGSETESDAWHPLHYSYKCTRACAAGFKEAARLQRNRGPDSNHDIPLEKFIGHGAQRFAQASVVTLSADRHLRHCRCRGLG